MDIVCPSCNTPAPAGSIFCDTCGYDLRGAPAAQACTGQPGVAPQPPAPSAPQPAAVSPAAQPAASPSQVEASFTPSVGARFCSLCGHANLPGANFCENCGARLAPPASPEPAAQAVPPVPAVSPPSPAPQPATPPALAQPPAPVAQPPATPSPAVPQAQVFVTGRLVIKGSNTSLPVPAGKSVVTIGREDPVSNIFPEIDLAQHGGLEQGVGRRHARLVLQNNQVCLEDMNSVNGTFLNQTRLAPGQPTPLKDGDELRMGNLALVYYVS